jgi:pyridoxine kinase
MPGQADGNAPLIVVASSHVAHGAVGNRIMVPALQALGCRVIEISTVRLSWHPGMIGKWGRPSRSVPSEQDFASLCAAIGTAPFAGGIAGIITGYLGDAGQAEILASMVSTITSANPGALYLCDPVIGDNNGLYVPEAVADAIHTHLWPLADIVTPNRFEFGWMAGRSEANKSRLATILTSAALRGGQIETHVRTPSAAFTIAHAAQENAPNGTGDLLAALVLGAITKGASMKDAVARAIVTIVAALDAADNDASGMIAVEHIAGCLNAERSLITVSSDIEH